MTRVLASLLCALLLSACLEHDAKVTWERSGQGTIEVQYVHDLEAAAALREKLYPPVPGYVEPNPFPAPEPFHEHWFRAHAKRVKGFTATSIKQTQSETQRTLTLKGRFDDLEAAMRAQVFVGTRSRLSFRKRKGDKPQRWELRFDDRLFDLEAHLDGQDREHFLKPLRAVMAGLRYTRTITLPTPVLESNGTVGKDGRTVRWTRKGDEMVGEDAAMWVVFAMDDALEIQPFDHDPFEKDKALLIRRFTREVPPPPPVADLPKPKPREEKPGEEKSSDAASPHGAKPENDEGRDKD